MTTGACMTLAAAQRMVIPGRLTARDEATTMHTKIMRFEGGGPYHDDPSGAVMLAGFAILVAAMMVGGVFGAAIYAAARVIF